MILGLKQYLPEMLPFIGKTIANINREDFLKAGNAAFL